MKIFGEQKKQVEFTAEELENAKKVITAMQDKNVDIVVKVESQKKKVEKKERLNRNLWSCVTEKEGEMIKAYAKEHGVTVSALVRECVMTNITNNAD